MPSPAGRSLRSGSACTAAASSGGTGSARSGSCRTANAGSRGGAQSGSSCCAGRAGRCPTTCTQETVSYGEQGRALHAGVVPSSVVVPCMQRGHSSWQAGIPARARRGQVQAVQAWPCAAPAGAAALRALLPQPPALLTWAWRARRPWRALCSDSAPRSARGCSAPSHRAAALTAARQHGLCDLCEQYHITLGMLPLLQWRFQSAKKNPHAESPLPKNACYCITLHAGRSCISTHPAGHVARGSSPQPQTP